MKVAFVNQPLDGVIPPNHNSIGIWTFYVAPYVAQTYDVTVYARWMRTQRSWKREKHLRYHFVHSLPRNIVASLEKVMGAVKNKDLPVFASQLYFLDYILPIAFHLRRQRVDIVHIHNFTQFVPLVRAFNPQAKIILHMNGEWLTQLDPTIMGQRAAACDLIFGSSNHITNLIRARFPHLAERCHTVYNGVNIDTFVPRSANGQHGNGRKRLLFVGRVSPEKGVHNLLEALPKIAEKHPDVQLDIVGPVGEMPAEYLVSLSDEPEVLSLLSLYTEPYATYLQRLIPDELTDQVHFTGNLPHEALVDYYHKADVLINPSYSESFGMSLVEALASECPVVATQVGGMVEIVNGSNAGILVKRGDVPGLTNAILKVLDDDQARATMGKAGRKMVIERFTWVQIAQRVMDFYRELLKHNG